MPQTIVSIKCHVSYRWAYWRCAKLSAKVTNSSETSDGLKTHMSIMTYSEENGITSSMVLNTSWQNGVKGSSSLPSGWSSFAIFNVDFPSPRMFFSTPVFSMIRHCSSSGICSACGAPGEFEGDCSFFRCRAIAQSGSESWTSSRRSRTTLRRRPCSEGAEKPNWCPFQ